MTKVQRVLTAQERPYCAATLLKRAKAKCSDSVVYGTSTEVYLNSIDPIEKHVYVVYVTESIVKEEALLTTHLGHYELENLPIVRQCIEAHEFKGGYDTSVLIPYNHHIRILLVGLGDVYDTAPTSYTFPYNFADADKEFLTSRQLYDNQKHVAEQLQKLVKLEAKDGVFTMTSPIVVICMINFPVINSYESDFVYGNTIIDSTEELSSMLVCVNYMNCDILSGIMYYQYKYDEHITDMTASAHKRLTKYAFKDKKDQSLMLDFFASAVEERVVTAESKLFARDLITQRANSLDCEAFTEYAKQLAVQHSDCLTCKVVPYEELRTLGYNLIAEVGKATPDPNKPRLVILEYTPPNLSGAKPSEIVEVAMIGKTLCFDTGGMCLKTDAYEMYTDMGGGGAVLGAMRSLAMLKPPSNKNNKILGVFAVAENSIGANAYRPSDIIRTNTTYKEDEPEYTTVCIIDTDAEGRNVLADAISYTQRYYKPKMIFDIATLTYDIMKGLGLYIGGVFGNNSKLLKTTIKSGSKHHEPFWHMPISSTCFEDIEGTDSDLLNCGLGKYNDCGNAAAFLLSFVHSNTKYVHLDIAGPSMHEEHTDASGFGVSTLYETIKNVV